MDFLKALTKRGRACSNSIASCKAGGVNIHQVRTKTTIGANSKKGRRYSVVRACCCTLKSMVLGLEGCLIRSTYGSKKSQHRDRINLEVTQSLSQAFGGCIDFQHAQDDFFQCAVQRRMCPSGPIMVPTHLACRTICISRNPSQFSKIHVRRESRSSVPY